MAAFDHKPSRRALLGVAAGLPLIVGSGAAEAADPLHQPSAGPPPRTGEEKWRRALGRYETAAEELSRYEACCSGRPCEEQMALEAGYDERLGATYDALRRLLRAPAPDVGALAAKLELVVAHEVGTLTGGEDCLAAICRDARRPAVAVKV